MKKSKSCLSIILEGIIILVIFSLILCGIINAYYWFHPEKVTYNTYAGAGERMKEQVLDFDEEVSVSYKSSELYAIAPERLASDLWKEMMKESDKPNEGDYLRFFCEPDSYKFSYTNENNKTYINQLNYKCTYYLTKSQEEDFEKSAENLVKELELDKKSDYEKVRAIYNYICNNITYDYEHLNDPSYLLQYTAYAALNNKTAVCAGIAQLFYYMAKSAGLDVRITINNSHAWNFVCVDGLYYYVDATWDLGLSEDQYKYFLKGRFDFDEHDGDINTNLTAWKWDDLTYNDQDEKYTFPDYAYGSNEGQ